MREFWRKVRWLFNRRQFERELDEEIGFHLAMKAGGNRQFGNVALLKEDSRAAWTWVFWEQLGQDIRYGLRTMAGNKLFTAMAVLSLALGIGANTAIYSFMDAVLMRSLPVAHPEELVVVKWHSPALHPAVIHEMYGTGYGDAKTGATSPNFPFAAYETLRTNHEVLTSLFAYAGPRQLNIVAQGQAEVANGQLVSGGFFSGLGVAPAAGRLIADDDDRAGAALVAVISYRYWQDRFASSRSAVGAQMLINNAPFTIVGVAAPGFFGVDESREPPIFLPVHAAPPLSPRPADYERQRFLDRNVYWVEMMGRLRPGVSKAQAQAALASQFRQYVESTAATPKERINMPALWLDEGGTGIDSLRQRYSKPLFVLMAMVALILTIACANIANLLLARATARRREMAIRLSLGAGRARVVRQVLTESVMLSLTGGALGLPVALWGIRSITWLLSSGNANAPQLHASLNWPVLGFTFALAIATGILFGLAPALKSTKVDLAPALKETRARGRTTGFGIGLSHALVVSQIAISLVMVMAAGLFVHTLKNLNAVELGFNRENLLVFYLNARQAGYKGGTLANFYTGLQDRFRAIPGVRNAALSQYALVNGNWDEDSVKIPGWPADEKRPTTCSMIVGPSFLPTMQIPIVLGRGMEPRDLQSPHIAVVSEQFVKQFFPNQSPIGQRIGFGDPENSADIEIIGVARNSRYAYLKYENPPVVYIPFTLDLKNLGSVAFELRTSSDPLALANTVRRIVHELSAVVPVSNVSTQAATIDQGISQERAFADLCTCFAALALAIACVGLYGTMAYTVARRTSEIGIRMALGAERRRIIWMVLREVLALAAVGLAIGLIAAWQAGHLVKSFLFGIGPGDPLALGVSVGVLACSALLAGYAPAWRASRIDPMAALRHE
jgi:predicted permease